MTSAAFPTVIAALVTTADAALSAEDVRVVRGYDLSDDPSDVVLIGVPSLSDTNAIAAGSFNQEATSFGRAGGVRTETGTVNCVVMARNGDGDQDAASDAAFNYLSLIGDALRATPSLGVTSVTELVAQLGASEVAEDRVDGATTAISFTVAYKALI